MSDPHRHHDKQAARVVSIADQGRFLRGVEPEYDTALIDVLGNILEIGTIEAHLHRISRVCGGNFLVCGPLVDGIQVQLDEVRFDRDGHCFRIMLRTDRRNPVNRLSERASVDFETVLVVLRNDVFVLRERAFNDIRRPS